MTATFTDLNNKEWTIRLDGPTVREVRKLGVDFVDLKSDPIAKLTLDPLLLADVAWVLCRDQATTGGLDSDQFQRALDGETNTRLIEALKEAIVTFSPAGARSLARSRLEQNEQTQKNAETLTIRKLTENQPRILTAMERRVDKEMEKILNDLESIDPSSIAAS